jgi:hypothetical protein
VHNDKEKNILLAQKYIDKHEKEVLAKLMIPDFMHHISMLLGRNYHREPIIFWIGFKPAMKWKIGPSSYPVILNQTHEKFRDEAKMVYEIHAQMAKENLFNFDANNFEGSKNASNFG